jgi:RNA polymerase sigma factor (sigma-70 family)
VAIRRDPCVNLPHLDSDHPPKLAAAMDYHQLLVESLDLIDRLVTFTSRRHHLAFSDTEELGSIVRLKLLENDFEVLRRFQGRSSLSTYLTIVIERLCLDYCVAKWGKWRPSAAALRRGPVAVLLESLIVRDEATFEQAVNVLQTNHRVTASRVELYEMLLQLPIRTGKRVAPIVARHAEQGVSDPVFNIAEDEEASREIARVLARAVDAVSPEDRQLLTLRFNEKRTVAEIARQLSLNPKASYRRLTQVLRRLRRSLEEQGVTRADVRRIVGRADMTLPRVLLDAEHG